MSACREAQVWQGSELGWVGRPLGTKTECNVAHVRARPSAASSLLPRDLSVQTKPVMRLSSLSIIQFRARPIDSSLMLCECEEQGSESTSGAGKYHTTRTISD